jgi:protein-arginine kinase activator protein McsA
MSMTCPNCGYDHSNLYEQQTSDGTEFKKPFRFSRSWKTNPPLATTRHHIEIEVTCVKCHKKFFIEDASW